MLDVLKQKHHNFAQHQKLIMVLEAYHSIFHVDKTGISVETLFEWHVVSHDYEDNNSTKRTEVLKKNRNWTL